MAPHDWQSSEIQKALFNGYVVNRFSVPSLTESTHMLFEQITLGDDYQMTIELALRILLRLYATIRSDAYVALSLLQVGKMCLPLDPDGKVAKGSAPRFTRGLGRVEGPDRSPTRPPWPRPSELAHSEHRQ